MRQFFVLILMIIFVQIIHAQTISGRILDEKTNEGLPFANVILLQDGKQINGTTTDLDGNYIFENVKTGTYDVEAVYVGYPNRKIEDVSIGISKIEMDIKMVEESGHTIYCSFGGAYAIPLIDLTTPYTGQKLRSWDIKRRP